MAKKVLIVFGTRPEAIKLAPVVRELKSRPEFNTLVCVWRQHREVLDQVLKAFSIRPDFDLPISISDKDLLGSGVGLIKKIRTLFGSGFGFLRFLRILKRERPDLLVVQGDTSTVFLAAFIAFHFKVPIAHVEAGLRTYDKYAPFPEEMNRQLLGRLADLHFAPTEEAKQNLLGEQHVPSGIIHVVGNTEIDALLEILRQAQEPRVSEALEKELEEYGIKLHSGKKILLVTAHRRESFGDGLKQICAALREIATTRKDVEIVYPVHPNPNVQSVVREALTGVPNILLTPPIAYAPFAFLMSRSFLVLTDSGGIQESAPSLHKPVLVMREKTERNEGVTLGVSKLVGTKREAIVAAAFELLDNREAYGAMTNKENPYGDGRAADRIADAITTYLQ